ncbi:MAG TPA: HNH endonuclease family protein [Candidatus Saccharibacteria bacterium]|nr:HNH endonuclease family protein [Candidatus Saccharibacteria bacterium]
MKKLRRRRLITVIVSLVIFGAVIAGSPDLWQQAPIEPAGIQGVQTTTDNATHILETLEVKGRAPKTGYARTQFGNGWSNNSGCDTRNTILYRDMTNAVTDENCRVVSGVLHDPYTDTVIEFVRGPQTSQSVQIDHVVALSNAWQTGAQGLTDIQRVALANDPLNLLAVDGAANQQKSDSDAASWLPSNKSFRCQYVARQIVVKKKYTLWVTPAEKEAILRVLRACPNQTSPIDHVDMIQ